jgi:hypothetical protein
MVNCNRFYVANTGITIQLRCVTHLCACPLRWNAAFGNSAVLSYFVWRLSHPYVP